MESIKNITNCICYSIGNYNFNKIKTKYECIVCKSLGRPINTLCDFKKIDESQIKCYECNIINMLIESSEQVLPTNLIVESHVIEEIPLVYCRMER